MKKEDLDFDLVDKLYQNLIQTSKIVGRLFIAFFTLMLLLSALVFEPELFPTNTPPGQSRIERLPAQEINLQNTSKVESSPDKLGSKPEPVIPLFGFKITQNIILKYSPLILAAIYLMLATYLIYLDFLKKEYFETYEDLYAQAEGEGESSLLYKIRLPNLHYILTDLSSQHSSKFVQLIYHTANVAKSLVLYVLPMVVLIRLLGEGFQRSSSNILNGFFWCGLILVIVGTIALTREWFIQTVSALNFFPTIIRSKELIKAKVFSIARYIIYILASCVTVIVVVFSVDQFFSTTKYLSSKMVKAMVTERNFYDSRLNPNGTGIKHQYESKTINGDKVVIDHATNLTWQQAGIAFMTYEETENYIQKLKFDKFASFDDWRLPTLEEAMSLMEPKQKNMTLFIDLNFDRKQRIIWTADKSSDQYGRTVSFIWGGNGHAHVTEHLNVRAVR